MEKTIDECFFQIQNGANIKQGDVDGGYPITRIETTANDKFNRDRMGYAGITDLSKYESYVLEDGDLLMSHINSVQYLGRTVLYEKQENETIIHGMNLLRLKARRDIINPAYARYCFYGHPFRSQVANITKKSVNQASFAVKDLKQLKIDVPEMNRQNQIVEILNKTNELIEKRQQELNTLDELIKARFVEVFGERGKVVPLTDYVWFQEGPGVRSVDFTDNGTILLTGSNINNNEISFGYKSDRFVSNDLASGKYAHFICDKDDILVVSSAIAPEKFDKKVTIVKEDKKYCLNTGIIRFKPNLEVMTLGYFREFLKTDYFKHQVMAEMRGIAQMHFGPSHLKQMTILLPESIEQQIEFEKFVKQVDKSKVVVQKALDETQTLFDSLMQEYFG